MQSLNSLSTAVKVGTVKNVSTSKAEPAVESLVELIAFCDNALRKEEEESGLN